MNDINNPICNRCIHRGRVRNSRHSCCKHPLAENITSRSEDLHRLMRSIVNENRIPWIHDNLYAEFAVEGIAQGYALWPFNFDPIWLISCTGFKEAV